MARNKCIVGVLVIFVSRVFTGRHARERVPI